MYISKALAAIIWIYSMVSYASFTTPENMSDGFSLSNDYFVLLIWPLLSIVFGLRARGSPFEIPSLTVRIDSICGRGAYARFLADVKPLMLFGMSGIVAGCSQLFQFYQQENDATAFTAAMMFDIGISFFIMRILLKRRGLLMEAHQDMAEA